MGRTVLIVDDDVDDRDIFREALYEIDGSIQCVCATNGDEALNILNQPGVVKPDYIFMDLNMPRLGGIQCLTSIKKTKGFLKYLLLFLALPVKTKKQK